MNTKKKSVKMKFIFVGLVVFFYLFFICKTTIHLKKSSFVLYNLMLMSS